MLESTLIPAPLTTTVALPCDKNSWRAMAASRGDFAAASGSDRKTGAETGAVSCDIFIVTSAT